MLRAKDEIEKVKRKIRTLKPAGLRRPAARFRFFDGLGRLVQAVPDHAVEEFVHGLWRFSRAAIEPPFQK
jgi:hypothetical protein